MNNFKKNILAVGSIAFDTIETAKGKRKKYLVGHPLILVFHLVIILMFP